MLRLALAAIGATLGWWIGILLGMTLGGAIGFFVSPLAGRILGGLFAGAVGGAVEARSNSGLRGMRLRFTGASSLATSLAAALLLDVQVLPWLVGGLFGVSLGAAQATAMRLPPRDALFRALTSSVSWSIGFLVLRDAGASAKLGVLAPGVAVLLLAVASSPRLRGAPSAAASTLA
jgi:hypothetical protein